MKTNFYFLDFLHNSIKSGDYVLFAYGPDKVMTLGKVIGEKQKSINVLIALPLDNKDEHYNFKEVLLKPNQVFKIELPDEWSSDYEKLPDVIFYGLLALEKRFNLYI